MGLSSPSKAQDSGSPIQLTITDALLSAHCVPASDNSQGLAFQSDSINRTLTIQGLNFLNGATPIVTLGGTGAQGGVVLPVSISIPTTPTSITVNFACGSLSAGNTLTALDNGVTTTIDSSDALLIGNSQTTAKGGISLAGVYSASSSSANVTIGVSCGTGGDTRTLTNGRINIVGANSVN